MGSAKIRHRRRRRQARRWTPITAKALRDTLDYIMDEVGAHYEVDWSKWFVVKDAPPRAINL